MATAAEAAIKQLHSELGSDILMDLTQKGTHAHISTGSILIDEITGIGGFPYGRIIELFGAESGGKTTLAWQAAANCQRDPNRKHGKGGRVLMLDYEHATDLRYIRRLGVLTDPEHLLISQPTTFEQGNRVAQVLIDNGAIDMLILDSIASVATEKEMAPDYEMSHTEPGYQSRIVSPAIKRLVPRLYEFDVCAILINQLRNKLNMRGLPAQQDTPGGRALKFYASMRMELVKTGSVKGKRVNSITGATSEGIVMTKVRATVVKNKMASPFASCELMMSFGEGFDNAYSLLEIGRQLGNLTTPRGGFIQYQGETIVRGLTQLRQRLREEDGFKESFMKMVFGNKSLQDYLETPYQEELADEETPNEVEL